jgi:hypothetical protein
MEGQQWTTRGGKGPMEGQHLTMEHLFAVVYIQSATSEDLLLGASRHGPCHGALFDYHIFSRAVFVRFYAW